MADDMSTIPPRVNTLEMELHTVKHRVTSLEVNLRDIPSKVTELEIAARRLPEIEKQLSEQGDMIKRGFIMTHGILLGAGGMWAVFNIGPKILKFLGGS
jgi:hypothetical protein